jgi:hypothetical protein
VGENIAERMKICKWWKKESAEKQSGEKFSMKIS